MMILTRRTVTTQNPEKRLYDNGQFSSEKTHPAVDTKTICGFPEL